MKRVLIDPGHGGWDPGAVQNGLVEKAVVLDVALRTARNIRLLSKEGDITSKHQVDICMTRAKDEYVSIDARPRMAVENNCDLLISIHNNSFTTGGANGARVIISKSGYYKRLSELTGNRILERLDACGLKNTGVKPDQRPWINFNKLGVLNGVDRHMPGVLIELGFLSNKHDAKLLSSADGREVIAIQIAAAAVQSLGFVPRMDLIV